MITPIQSIPLTAGGGTVNLTLDNLLAEITGTATLTGSWTIQLDSSQSSNVSISCKFNFIYRANIALSGNTITIFGRSLLQSEASQDNIITCFYDGSAWNVFIQPITPNTQNYQSVAAASTVSVTKTSGLTVLGLTGNSVNVATVTLSNVQTGDLLLLTSANTAGNTITIVSGGNLNLNNSQSYTLVGGNNGGIWFCYLAGAWQEITRQTTLLKTATTALSTSGNTITLTPLSARYQILTGTGTLVANTSVSASDTFSNGDVFYINYQATFGGTSTVTIFGITLNSQQILEGNTYVIATYDGSTWQAVQTLNFEGIDGNNIIVDANIVSLSASKLTGTLPNSLLVNVPVGKLALTTDNLVVGSSGVGSALPALVNISTTEVLASTAPQYIGQQAYVAGNSTVYVGTARTAGSWVSTVGGGGAFYNTFRVALTSAQILSLNSTPIILAPAPGTGKAIEFVGGFARLIFNTTAYATNTVLQIVTDTANEFQATNLDTLASTVTRACIFTLDGYSATTNQTQIVENKALTLIASTGNPTAGDGTLVVYGTYKIWTL
jgi:hypothetical protein